MCLHGQLGAIRRVCPHVPTCRADLAQYDNSTIPVVFHAVWQFNYAHVATASLAWIWNNINQSSNAPLVERAR